MEAGNFELYPILHNGRIYNILTETDMTFREVRAMIDWLDREGAFPRIEGEVGSDGKEEPRGPSDPGTLYSCSVEGIVFDVDVQGFDVVVYRRQPPA